MSISELSVRKPVTVAMLYLLACVVACVFIPRLGVALYPSTTMPMISISTTYSNVGPEEIDTNVTDVIENRLSRISGIKSISSVSQTGSSRVMLEFGYDKDLDEAYDDINAALSNISNQLPDNCGTPSIMKFDMSSMPIMRLAVEGDLALNELKTIAEDTVQPLLERVDGVASAEVMGGAAKEIHVDVSRNRLEAYGITISQIASALSARNVQISSGSITQDGTDYEIVTDEYYASLDDIRNTIITTTDAASVRIDDVAEVFETYDKDSRSVYINGMPGLYISISNESGTNASSISKGVHEMLETVNEQLPKGVSVRILSDDTTLIDSTMQQVYSSAVQGAILAMLIIFLFLRSVKSSVIIGLSIPISFVLTLMVMAFMDLTVNLMTMSGLILGMGMTVDSSIVILENIELRRQKGEKSAIAAILGSRNMMTAIFASTMTTLCVFLPMLIYQAELEMLGQMFKEMVITVCVSLIASLIVSVTLVPALCGSILKLDTRMQKPLKNKFFIKADAVMEKALKSLENAYCGVLRFCLNNRFLVLTLVGIMLIVSVMQFASMGVNLTPSSSADDQVNISITMPIGTNNKVVEQYLFDFQDIILQEIGDSYETIVLNTGTSNSGSIQINLPELANQTMNPTQIKAKLRPYMNQWSDATVSFSSGRGPGGSSSAIDIELISNDTSAVADTADKIIDLLKESVPELTDVESDIESGSPRYRITINTDAAAAAGVSVTSIAQVMKTAISGSTATTFHSNGTDVDVIVAMQESDMQSPSDIGALTVSTQNGLLPLDNFITYAESRAPQKIQREDGERINHVTASLADGATATEVQSRVERLISENIVLPETVELSYGGDARDIAKFGGAFAIVIALAVFLVFVVMAAQFESLVDPLIIFISIPLLLIGVVGIYKLTGSSLSMYSYVGIVALAGIVVNNGIVLVDFTNQLVREKMPVREACLAAGRNRLRPILMTTLTTVLGMTPMAFFPGEGAESMQPICLTIVG
ncbi:efflux RND transporter permease subunit [Treponema brennaborense]|uniref:efflux RND transporter permease subunit n=1 Tax=Treponema brennaborense TaxID=81028 RepID=UPI0003185E69|nr:efflux RND transporter permease subunit [Treponema brennaborense]